MNKDNPEFSFAGKPLDIWALGVTLYIMTFNRLPIKATNEDNTMELLDLISKPEINFPESETRKISKEMKDLMMSLLEKNPEKRLTSEQIKKHPWVNIDKPLLFQEE